MLNKIRNRKIRLKLSMAAGILAVILAGGKIRIESSMIYGWWGMLYPRFCFAEEKTESDRQEEGDRPKISFWLAKVLDR